MRKTKEALMWIVTILRKNNIPFQISGGLAARLYGSRRKLADIDIEVPEESFKKILPEVKEFIIYGPTEYKDDNWRLLMMTLKYKGQVIDLGGAFNTKIFDQNKRKWISLKSDYSRTVKKRVYGIQVPVISRKLLFEYKSKLLRKVDKEDIRQMSK